VGREVGWGMVEGGGNGMKREGVGREGEEGTWEGK
jgi:hypothetical protein